MSIDSPPIPPVEESKSNNRLLWGCLIALLAALVISCCGISLLITPFLTDFNPLGIDLREEVEAYLPEDLLEAVEEGVPVPAEPSRGEGGPSKADGRAEDFPLAVCAFNDFGVTFSYPAGWDIEIEGYSVTFYDPDSYTYLYVGEALVDPGSTAEGVVDQVLDSLREDAQEDSVKLLSRQPYSAPIAGDAHLALFEWVDQDGYYTWAYDLEIVDGESNVFFFLSGEDPDEIELYGELLDIIAASLTREPVLEVDGDA